MATIPHAPDVDRGVIAPTAALASMPYTPEQSMQALRHFYYDLARASGANMASPTPSIPATGWVASDNLAIDQGPIVVMIENYRTGFLWRLFMSCPEVAHGLRALGFKESSAIA